MMKCLPFFILSFLLLPFVSISQNNDCIVAELICSSGGIAINPSGPGINDFAPEGSHSGCLATGEHQSAWYYFQFESSMPPNSIIEFTITPDAGPGQDYDFAVFGPEVNCAVLGSPIRCSYAAGGCDFCPQTGLGMGATDLAEPPQGDGFVAPLVVQPGQGFYLLIDNFSNNSTGFSMTWGGTAAPFLDCMLPQCIVNVTATPSYTLCEGSAPTQLTANATGVTNAVSYEWTSSNGGVAYLSNRFIRQPFISVPLGAPDTIYYALIVRDGVCTDTANVVVNVLEAPTPVITGLSAFCAGNSIVLNTTAGYSSYQWSTGSTDSAIIVGNPGTFSVTVSNALGCAGAASKMVRVVPALTTVEASFCENDSLLFADSLITAAGIYEWQYTTALGCDSLVRLTVTEFENVFTELNIMLVPGQPYEGTIYLQDTTLEFALQTIQGCDSLVRVHLQIVTSTDEPGRSLLAVHLFPNPTTGAVTLRFDQMPSEPMRIYLFNELGQTVLVRKLSTEQEQRLNLDGLPSASYRAVIMAAGKVLAVEKLVIL